MPMREDRREVDSGEDIEKEHPIETPSERVQLEKSKEVQTENVTPFNESLQASCPISSEVSKV